MKKLVTLMLALSLGGSQVFAAGSPAINPQQNAQERTEAFGKNTVLFAGFAAILCCLVSTGEDSFLGKVSQALEAFVAGDASTGIDTVVNHFVNPLKAKLNDVSDEVQAACLTAEEVAALRQEAVNGNYDEAGVLKEAAIAKTNVNHRTYKPMFKSLRKLMGIKSVKQQDAVTQYIQTMREHAQAQSEIGNP